MVDRAVCVGVCQARHNYEVVQCLIGAQRLSLSEGPSHSLLAFLTECAATLMGPTMLEHDSAHLSNVSLFRILFLALF